MVTISRAKRAKTEQIKKTEIVAILRLAKGFSWIFYQIPNRRFRFEARLRRNACHPYQGMRLA
jgi:hypothetical protein